MNNLAHYRLFKLLSFLVFCLPLGVLLAVNRKSYFTSGDVKLSVYGYMLLTSALVGFKDKLLLAAKSKTLFTFSLTLFIVALAMHYIADELTLLSAATLVGSLLSELVEPIADVYYNLCYERNGDAVRRVSNPKMTARDAARLAYGLR